MYEMRGKVKSVLEYFNDLTLYWMELEKDKFIITGCIKPLPLNEHIIFKGIPIEHPSYKRICNITEYITTEGHHHFPQRVKKIQDNNQSNKIKTIPTKYGGVTFRSRLEARWAVFLDALEIPYVYEYEGFNLKRGGYFLPDFFLTKQNTFIEIKPFPFSYNDIEDILETEIYQKCEELAEKLNFWVYLVAGNPFFDEYTATAITPGDFLYLRQGHLALLQVPVEKIKEEYTPQKKGFFQKFLSSPAPIQYRYLLYPVKFGEVYTHTEEKQRTAYHAARYAKFF